MVTGTSAITSLREALEADNFSKKEVVELCQKYSLLHCTYGFTSPGLLAGPKLSLVLLLFEPYHLTFLQKSSCHPSSKGLFGCYSNEDACTVQRGAGSYPYSVTIVYPIISGRDLVNRFSTLLVAVPCPVWCITAFVLPMNYEGEGVLPGR